MMAYSLALAPCTPRLFVSTAPSGSQSSGNRWFTPAPWACTHLQPWRTLRQVAPVEAPSEERVGGAQRALINVSVVADRDLQLIGHLRMPQQRFAQTLFGDLEDLSEAARVFDV